MLKIGDDDGIVVIVSARPTSVGDPVLSKGPFKGKRVECPSTTGIETLQDISDFVGVDNMEIGDMLARIREVYGLDVADLPNANPLEIFRRLHDKRERGLSGGLAQ